MSLRECHNVIFILLLLIREYIDLDILLTTIAFQYRNHYGTKHRKGLASYCTDLYVMMVDSYGTGVPADPERQVRVRDSHHSNL